jgi:hypothetical protein
VGIKIDVTPARLAFDALLLQRFFSTFFFTYSVFPFEFHQTSGALAS